MSKGQPSPIGIADFVKQIREEILEAQKDAKKPLLQLDDIELEIKFVTEKEGKAGIKLWVVSIGGKYSKEQTHTVKLKLSPYKPSGQTVLGPQGQVLPATDTGTVILRDTGPDRTVRATGPSSTMQTKSLERMR